MIGLLDISAASYHADQLHDAPTLSASIATVLVTRSPRHAWANHPRLNPDYEREDKPAFDLGTLVHQILLEGHMDSLVEVPYNDFKTNAAKAIRDEARAAGKTPILSAHLPRVFQMVTAVREQLDTHEAAPPLLTDGKPEQTIVWEEDGGVVCRARLDWLRDDLTAIDDIKTSSQSAAPESCARTVMNLGYDVRAAFYLRGIEKTLGARPEWRWIFCETKAPYAVSVISPAPALLALGAAKVDTAIATWRRCLAANEWPSYPSRVAYVDPPAWAEAQWLEREYAEQEAA